MAYIKALDKLRNLASKENGGYLHDELKRIANLIQTEVDVYFMALPLDADDVPIHCGDKVRSIYSSSGIRDIFAVNEFSAIAQDKDGYLIDIGRRTLMHVNSRTLEEILADIANNIALQTDGKIHHWEASDFGDEADEIRELLSGDAQ